MRPKIVPGIPLEYKKLMEQCWDADSTKRPNACTLIKEQLSNSTDPMNINYTSKNNQFENFSEPKNATEVVLF
ncbi:hypothetical protein RhiirA1_478106 [Rhizophagus irregularis]|uniref:Serine-threonine/tyrosine-protein kinase catalytic domain-containing protein n=1 Tax=Rhizophagus irregularis TaxID=588596 RepID=A0A2N0QSL6_9GLOM|nr:hypothetical protein RhiirA1_478106 [Rhizophagus irregularis]